ncbi:MAG TPA: hypothetical protein VLB67_10515 [Acidimicrobiia bacterium]|nr:hypothetical protein [Acidimicrobiia bacterium]
MTSKTPALVTKVWTALVALASIGVAVAQPLDDATLPETISVIGWLVLPVVFTTLGTLIFVRQPGNRISWILLTIGVGTLMDAASHLLLATPPDSLDVATWVAIQVSNTAWLVIFLSLFNLLYVFPDGKLLSRRWRWVYWAEGVIVATVVLLGVTATEIGPSSSEWTTENPIGFVRQDLFSGVLQAAFSLLLFTIVGGGLAAIVIRWRRSPTLVRNQIKWVAYAGAVFIVGYGVAFGLSVWGDAGILVNLVFVPAITAIPLAITAAILRYRLFEIDRIVSRTVTYAVVVGVLAVLYLQSVTLLTRVLPLESDVAVAVSTLAVAVLFTPIRRKVQTSVDRRFNRTRYIADRELDKFTTRLKTNADVHEVEDELIAVSIRTLQPEALGLWIRQTRD